LEAWSSRLLSETQTSKTAMKVDYETYADGEALLGWLNCMVSLSAGKTFTAGEFLCRLASKIQERLRLQRAEIAHLKMTIKGDGATRAVAVANLVRNDTTAETALQLPNLVSDAQLTINLRAEAARDVLGTAVR